LHYLIYKTTNLVNGKYYVGKHKTKNRDDNYLGSGKLLCAAIKKYGRENFVREIILECYSEEEMNLAERILVVPDLEVNYNLCPGGQGGFGYIATHTEVFKTPKRRISQKINSEIGLGIIREKISNDDSFLIKRNRNTSIGLKRKWKKDGHPWSGRKHSDITKQKMSTKARNRTKTQNSQYGTRWMTDGKISIKVKSNDVDIYLSTGYYFGRKCSGLEVETELNSLF